MAVYCQVTLPMLFALFVLATQGSAQNPCAVQVTRCASHVISSQGIGIQNIPSTLAACGTYQEIEDCMSAIKGDTSCESQIAQIKAAAKDVLVDSGICDKKDEVEKYSACWSKPELVNKQLCASAAGQSQDICQNLLATVNCYKEKTKTSCGEKQSELVDHVMRTMSRTIAKTMQKECPDLASGSSHVRTVGCTLIMSLWMILVAIFTFN